MGKDDFEKNDASDENKVVDPEKLLKKFGRPKKNERPNVPWSEVESLLVHGDAIIVDGQDTGSVTYPSFRDLGDRYNVSHTLIAKYSKQHNCMARRKSSKKRMTELADTKLIELRADKLAVTRDDTIRVIDKFIAKFEESLDEGRVRCDNPTDFNTMLRLKSFIMGDADSRQEVISNVTLETLQQQHLTIVRMESDTTPELSGEANIKVVEAAVVDNNLDGEWDDDFAEDGTFEDDNSA